MAPLPLEPTPGPAAPESLRGSPTKRRGPPKPPPALSPALERQEREALAFEVELRKTLEALESDEGPETPAPVPAHDETPSAPPPPRKQPTMTTTQKDPNKIVAHNEVPHEKIQEFIASGYGPTVYAEIRRAQPGGGTITIKKHIAMPITAYPDIGEKMANLLCGGGTLVVSLAQNKGERPFISWKEGYEMPPRVVPRELTLAYNPEAGDFEIVTAGLDAMGGVAVAGGALPISPYAAALPPQPAGPAGVLSPPGAPVFPMPQRDAAGRLLPPPQGLLEPWMTRYPIEQQWQLARETYSQRHGVELPNFSATQVAMQWNAREAREVEAARTQAARYEERLDANRDRSQALLEQERMARSNLERQVAELRAQMMAKEQQAEAARREAEFKAKMDLLEMKIAGAGAKSSTEDTLKTVATLATALAPVAVAYVQTSKQQAAAEIQAREEFQRTLLATLSQKQSSGLSEIVPLVAALAPVAAPAIQQWLANNDPEKLDEARHNQDQRNLMFMKFMFDMMQAQMGGGEGEPEPFWFRFLKELAPQLMGLGKVAMIAAANGQGGGALPPGRREPLPPPAPGQTQVMPPEEVPPAPVAAPPPTVSYALDVAATVQQYAQMNPEAAQMLGFILNQLSRTPGAEGFLSPEWASILFHLHAKLDPEELAILLVDHLEHSRTFSLLPPPMAAVFTDPRTALMGIIPALPIWTIDEAYAQRVVDLVTDEITAREKERIEAASELRDEEAQARGDAEDEAENEEDEGEAATVESTVN